MSTSTAAVAGMTKLEDLGCSRMARSEPQRKVLTGTMTITATRAAMGMRLTRVSSTRMRNSRKAPAHKQDDRPRAPEETLITDWSIIAQPAMPPSGPAPMLTTPWPTRSRLLSLALSVISSTRGGHQRLQQPDRGEGGAVGEDDPQRFEGQRHVRQQENRQRRREPPHVADGAEVGAQRDRDAGLGVNDGAPRAMGNASAGEVLDAVATASAAPASEALFAATPMRRTGKPTGTRGGAAPLLGGDGCPAAARP